MATTTPYNTGQSWSGSIPSAADWLEGLTYVSGLGIAFVSFLAPIPGLLPGVLLTVLLGAVVLIPIIVVGAAIGAVFGLLLLLARIVGRGVSAIAGGLEGTAPRGADALSRS